MKWYRNLYVGDNAKKAKYKVLGKVIKKNFTVDTFLITISENPDNILDIVSPNVFKQKHFDKKYKAEYQDNIYVVGIAKGYDEALEVVRCIVDETYKQTGSVKVAEYLNFGRELRK